MRVVILNGSPRVNGNTSEVSHLISDHLRSVPSEVSILRLYNMNIAPCVDCRSCKSGELRCVLEDDMPGLCDRIEESDAIIVATPVYWFGPSAKTKLMIDRLRPYYLNGKLRGKKGALILVAGEGYKDSGLTISMFRRIFRTLGIIDAGSLALKAYEEGDVLFNKALSGGIRSICAGITTADQ
jgi:multimeric flavodoxin WrbA